MTARHASKPRSGDSETEAAVADIDGLPDWLAWQKFETHLKSALLIIG